MWWKAVVLPISANSSCFLPELSSYENLGKRWGTWCDGCDTLREIFYIKGEKGGRERNYAFSNPGTSASCGFWFWNSNKYRMWWRFENFLPIFDLNVFFFGNSISAECSQELDKCFPVNYHKSPQFHHWSVRVTIKNFFPQKSVTPNQWFLMTDWRNLVEVAKAVVNS